ncbi:MAG: hydroxymethylglutaryl-CoA lyase [bacterium]
MSTRVVDICEVGPRDGLQNEKRIVSVDDKLRFITLLARAGFREIEATSFVSPKWVPQLADAEEVLPRAIAAHPATLFSVLVPNEKGLERALACGARKVSVFTAASEGFARKNINATIGESIVRFEPVVRRAHEVGVPVRGYVSCVVACPYDGAIAPSAVADTCARLAAIGVDELDLGDTIGAGTPETIAHVLDECARVRPIDEIVLHLHDTHGRAVDCARRALELGVRRFDGSAAGIGGCPYAPGARGNVATESLVDLCASLGYSTSIDRTALGEAARFITGVLAAPLPAGDG